MAVPLQMLNQVALTQKKCICRIQYIFIKIKNGRYFDN